MGKAEVISEMGSVGEGEGINDENRYFNNLDMS